MNDFCWDDLRYFLAAAEYGSLSAAAKQLDSNQPTVGRHITALETALGMSLFQRTRNGLTLTQEGMRLLVQAQEISSGMLNIARLSGDQLEQPQGSVRLALPEGLCNEVVVPNLQQFYEQYPLVRLILHVSSGAANLTRGEADIAIRLFRPHEANLVARQLGTMDMGLCASRDYLRRHGIPFTEADLRSHFVIAYGDTLAALPENQWLLANASPERVLLQSDSTNARRIATETGLGVSIQPRVLIRRSPDLISLLEQVTPTVHPVWLVYHRDLKHTQRIRVVLTFLAALLTKEFSGTPNRNEDRT